MATLPLQIEVLANVHTEYTMGGVWEGLSLDQKSDTANTVNAVLKAMPWVSSPFTSDTTFDKISGVYNMILRETAENGGAIERVFDPSATTINLLNPYFGQARDDLDRDQSKMKSIEYV